MRLTLPSGPSIGLLKHFTKCRPRLPFWSVVLTNRFKGSRHWQSGHRSIGTAPYTGHFDCEAEELDISMFCVVAGEEKEGEWGKHGDEHGHDATLF